jgi:alkaline phosphatase
VLVARYTTGRHTANLVPLFAIGPESERFGGIIDNDRIGQLLLEIVGREE